MFGVYRDDGPLCLVEIVQHYSTDIAAAWQVVEELRHTRHWCVLLTVSSVHGHQGCIIADLGAALYPIRALVEHIHFTEFLWDNAAISLVAVNAETVALAICRAALHMVGVTEVESA